MKALILFLFLTLNLKVLGEYYIKIKGQQFKITLLENNEAADEVIRKIPFTIIMYKDNSDFYYYQRNFFQKNYQISQIKKQEKSSISVWYNQYLSFSFGESNGFRLKIGYINDIDSVLALIGEDPIILVEWYEDNLFFQTRICSFICKISLTS